MPFDPNKQVVVRSLQLIYEHIDAPLSVPELARAVGVSDSVLKRAFAEALETSPAALSRRLRLEIAFRTLRSRDQSVLETALASGFEDHAAFSRSFRRAFGFAPSGAREVVQLHRQLESSALEEPDIVELEALPLQVSVAQGPYYVCAGQAWQKLLAAVERLPESSQQAALFVGRALDDPHASDGPAPDAVRFAAGVFGVEQDLGLERFATRAGVYARFRFQGKLANVGLAYHHIYGEWRERAADSGYILAEEPALIMLDGRPDQLELHGGRVMIAVPLVTGVRRVPTTA